MTEEQNQFQFNRLFQTLVYFEIIPGLSCLKKALSYLQNQPQQGNKSSILLIGFTHNCDRNLLKMINDNQYNIRVIVADRIEARKFWGDRAELLNVDNLTPAILNNVELIIYHPRSNLNLEKITNFISQNMTPTTEKMLFDFTNPNVEIKEVWGALDDVVMGGISNSNIIIEQNKAIFSGNISTQNNGGFASVRTRNLTPPLDLSAYSGIELRLKGDGKRYKFIARCEGKWDGLAYCYSFDTIYDFPQNIRIYFKDLIPTFRAKTVSNADKFDANKVYSLQLMLSKFEYDGQLNPKFEAGFFTLEIEHIKAFV